MFSRNIKNLDSLTNHIFVRQLLQLFYYCGNKSNNVKKDNIIRKQVQKQKFGNNKLNYWYCYFKNIFVSNSKNKKLVYLTWLMV